MTPSEGSKCQIIPLGDWIKKAPKPSTLSEALRISHAKIAYYWQLTRAVDQALKK